MKRKLEITFECPYSVRCEEIGTCVCENKILKVLHDKFPPLVGGSYKNANKFLPRGLFVQLESEVPPQ